MYNQQWQHVESIILLYDGSAWDNFLHYTYQYNTGGDITVEIEQSWSGEAWVDSYKYLYTYLRSSSVSEILELYWNGDAWENSYKETYFYNPVGIAEKADSGNGINLSAYPNPFRDHLQVSFDLEKAASVSLAIYDLGGKMVEMITTGTHYEAGSQTINWKSTWELTGSAYILKLTVGSDIYSSKVLKKN
jgi:hypothetical protein